jgi:hypothetical protein
VDFIVTPWLIHQAIKLVAIPLGEESWNQFKSEIGKRIGGGAAEIAEDWMRRVAAPQQSDGNATADADLVNEMQQQPETASKVGAEIGRRLEMKLSSSAAIAPSNEVRPADEVVLDAYEAVSWRLAVLAFAEDRPIAVAGALQGENWVTACIPQNFAIGPSEPPEPSDIWMRFDRKLRLGGDDWRRANYFVRSTPPGRAPNEAAALDRSFRVSGDAAFPPESDGAALADRWHRVNGISALWVQLQPDSQATTWIIDRGQGDLTDLDHPLYEAYPPEWKPLLEIPDEVEGVTLLDRSADAFAAQSAALKARMAALFQ